MATPSANGHHKQQPVQQDEQLSTTRFPRINSNRRTNLTSEIKLPGVTPSATLPELLGTERADRKHSGLIIGPKNSPHKNDQPSRNGNTNGHAPLTGHGTYHDDLEAPLARAEEQKSDHEAEPQFECPTAMMAVRFKDMAPQDLLDLLNSQIVGRSLIIDTVFGPKLKLYCDYTASGQELRFIVDLMTKVEEYYANTHTEMSMTGAYMNNLLNEAELAILKSMGASGDDYFVIAGGSGSTYAIEMAQKFLGTYLPPATRDQLLKLFPPRTTWQDLKAQLRSQKQLPLVIVSHYEHHSNEVTWRNQFCDLAECPPRIDGHVDLDRLESILRRNRHRPVIGSFSAGSNVTGLKTDVFEVAAMLKTYNALAFFDYAAVGPYVPIDLSQKTKDGRCLIDGVYISPHKFLGGPGSCGVLVFNRPCYNAAIEPSHGGGGTVDFVGRRSQLFAEDPTHREKSGTPGILQIIKAGLAFQLKTILQPVIDEKERRYLERFYSATRSMKNLQILGPPLEESKVVIMSFMVHHKNGPKGRRYLHQNLVVRLLNDVFGIQARAGCSCAGPYGLYLLNIDDDTSQRLRFWVEPHPSMGDHAQLHGFKIGWTRVNLHFTLTDYEIDYLLFALGYICEHGHRFLSVYEFNPVSGQWHHAGQPHKEFPSFGFETLLGDVRQYADSESSRSQIFDRQRKEALALLGTLPPVQDLDSIPEMPFSFFYVEKPLLLERNVILAKSAAYEEYYSNAWPENTGHTHIPSTPY